MEFKLKTISPEGIDAALSKAEVYRFLNEPEEAESICQDVLTIHPGHQLALRLLGLALTDQFSGGTSDRYSDAVNAFQQLTDHYEQLYYTGLLYERAMPVMIAFSVIVQLLSLPVFLLANRMEQRRPSHAKQSTPNHGGVHHSTGSGRMIGLRGR